MTLLCVALPLSAKADGALDVDIHYDSGSAPTVTAYLYNHYSDTRYCELFILTGANRNAAVTSDYRAGNRASGDYLDATDSPSGTHIWGKGVIYNSATPYAGVAWSDEKQVK